MPSPAAHIYSRPIRFAETDAAGIAHFSRLLVIVEEAVHNFFHVRGISVFDATTAWPVVSLQTDYKSPCRFGEVISIGLNLERIGPSSVTILFEAHKPDGALCFTGRITLCHLDPAQAAASPIPEKTRNALLAASV